MPRRRGGGFLEIAEANVSDPLMPPTTDAIQSITFSEVPEPTSAGLALLALAAFTAASPRCRRQIPHIA
jgi:MYXO-CTERM domain-containing protein